MKHPDRNQCYEYLKEKNTPQHVVGHCKSVAAVAYILGRALNEAGGTKAVPFGEIKFKKTKFTQSGREHYMQDPSCKAVGTAYRDFALELVLASGLLHDIARKEERHWDVGADFCKNLNLPEEENIIRIHMQYEFTNDEQNLTEADLVCLGDRLSIEDRYVGLDKRMDYIIDKKNYYECHWPRIATVIYSNGDMLRCYDRKPFISVKDRPLKEVISDPVFIETVNKCKDCKLACVGNSALDASGVWKLEWPAIQSLMELAIT